MQAVLHGVKRVLGMGSVPRVAVLGGGVSGCSAAHHLALLGCNVSIFEMGRSLGGRAGARRSRAHPGLAINHGAPLFDVRTEEGTEIMERLEAAGRAVEYTGVRGVLSAERGFSSSSATAVNWVGAGASGMAAVSEGLVEEVCKAREGSVACHFGALVTQLVPVVSPSGGEGEVQGWSLCGADGQRMGGANGADGNVADFDFDWLVVSGSGAAHPRWGETFKGREAPLLAAVRELRESGFDDPVLAAALECIGAQRADPCLVAMCTAGAGTKTAAQWDAALPFDMCWITESDVLQKVSVQRGGDESDSGSNNGNGTGMITARTRGNCDGGDSCRVSLVVHSTADYARAAPKDALGTTSAAAQVGGAPADAERGAALAKEMLSAFEALTSRHAGRFGLGEISLNTPLEPLAWGPHLHRWGNCLPRGEPLLASDAVAPRARVAFCGDFVEMERRYGTSGRAKYVPRMGSAEAALLSGAAAARGVMQWCS